MYADFKVGGGAIIKGEAGISASASGSLRSSFGSLYNQAERFSHDKNFTEAVDHARRDAKEMHYRVSDDAGNRLSQSITRSFDEGDSFRKEASSSFSKAESYSTLASQTQENASSINANFGQEFYQWMRTQPSIYGQGTMSRSMIDNMSVADMQHYADRFSQEKSSQMLNSFNHDHHLSEGKSDIARAYSQNNQAIGGLSHVKNHDHRYQQVINNEVTHNDVGHVDQGMSNTVTNQLALDEKSYNEKKAADLHRGNEIEEQARAKVKGQVFGSLGKVTNPNDLVKETTESLHE